MKALLILQPWAWLILHARKDIENRTWPTRFRGRFLIHAGKGYDHDGATWLSNNWHAAGLPDTVGDLFDKLRDGRERFEIGRNRGGIVGAVTLTGCVETSESRWFSGPFGFTLADPVALPFVPIKGALGFFEVPDELVPAGAAARAAQDRIAAHLAAKGKA